jgi:AcrR family transcriptional regulator
MSQELIKSVARDLFNRLSFTKTSMDDIARGCKLGKGTIYLHFKSKDEIFMAIASERMEERFQADQVWARDPAIPVDEKILRHAATFVEDSLYIKKLLFGDYEDINGRVVKEIFFRARTLRLRAQELLLLIASGGRQLDDAQRQRIMAGIAHFQECLVGSMITFILDNEWHDQAGLMAMMKVRAPALYHAFIPEIR